MRVLIPLLLFAALGAAEDRGVVLEVVLPKAEFEIGEPILGELRFTNRGEETWEIDEPHVIRFYEVFEARDRDGDLVPNPFGDIVHHTYSGPVERHALAPGATVTIRRFVNANAAFSMSGAYTVRARYRVAKPRPEVDAFVAESPPVSITLKAPDPDRRRKEIAELKRLLDDPRLAETELKAWKPLLRNAGTRTGALRLLAFHREQSLMPLFLDLTEKGEPLAAEALAGLPDREAVFKALKARVENPAEHDTRTLRDLYASLAVPKTDALTWEEVFERRRALLGK